MNTNYTPGALERKLQQRQSTEDLTKRLEEVIRVHGQGSVWAEKLNERITCREIMGVDDEH